MMKKLPIPLSKKNNQEVVPFKPLHPKDDLDLRKAAYDCKNYAVMVS